MRNKNASKIVKILFIIICQYNYSLAQEKIKIKDVRKNCVKATYGLGISTALKFIKQEPDNFEPHYLLAQCYVHKGNDLANKQNEYVKLYKNQVWTEKEYQGEIDILKNVVSSLDSAVYFYKKSHDLIDDSFLKKNTNICKLGVGSCYNEFSGGITLDAARKFLDSEIKSTTDVGVSNKKIHDKVVGELADLKKKEEEKLNPPKPVISSLKDGKYCFQNKTKECSAAEGTYVTCYLSFEVKGNAVTGDLGCGGCGGVGESRYVGTHHDDTLFVKQIGIDLGPELTPEEEKQQEEAAEMTIWLLKKDKVSQFETITVKNKVVIKNPAKPVYTSSYKTIVCK